MTYPLPASPGSRARGTLGVVVARYCTTTQHLLGFVRNVRPVRLASQFTARDAEALNTCAKRLLMDKDVNYVLECCRTLFAYTPRRQHRSAQPFSLTHQLLLPVAPPNTVRDPPRGWAG